MDKELTTHRVEGELTGLSIAVVGDPDKYNGHHRYDVKGFDTRHHPGPLGSDGYSSGFSCLPVIFQKGPITEHGPNGVTMEALLAIAMHRLEGYQAGPCACQENARALFHLNEALEALQSRTRKRLADQAETALT